VHITLTAKVGYSSVVGDAISAAVAGYINALGSGEPVVYSKLWLPANLCDAAGVPTGTGATYDITLMKVGTPPSTTQVGYGTANIPIKITQIAHCLPADVVIVVSP